MIEQLSKMKKQSIMETAGIGLEAMDGSEERRVNALIEQYQKQIKAAQVANFYTPAAPASGALFSISA
jgi:2-oxo-4-hydroxy-4-carboxy--5-ureidoimidazoline (OHCU) decarboxylase